MKFNLRLVSMILYTVSLALPVFYGSDLLGFHALIMGWMSIPAGDICMALPWLSNAGYIALLMIRSGKKAWPLYFPYSSWQLLQQVLQKYPGTKVVKMST